MFEPIHMEYALKAPDYGTHSLPHLFQLLDRLDSTARDTLLTPIYLAYEISFDQRGERESQMKERYDEFKRTFTAANAMCKDEKYVVFGLVSFVLGEASRKSDPVRFEGIIGGHRSFISDWKAEMVKEELPAPQVWQQIRETMDKIESLHKELEESRNAYRLFCAEVVKALL